MNTAVHVEQTGFFFKGRFFCSVLGHKPCWCASFFPQTAKKTPHARESNREAKLRSTIWSRGETPLPERLRRARTSACPQDDAQCNKPRDRVGDSHAKQESPISPINNMWMSENTVLFPWTPVETICYDLRVTQQHETVQTCSPLVREFSAPQQIASNLQQSHSARLGEGAQKSAHHGPLLLCPPAASYPSTHPGQCCSMSFISKCSFGIWRWLVGPCSSLTCCIWHMKSWRAEWQRVVLPVGSCLGMLLHLDLSTAVLSPQR